MFPENSSFQISSCLVLKKKHGLPRTLKPPWATQQRRRHSPAANLSPPWLDAAETFCWITLDDMHSRWSLASPLWIMSQWAFSAKSSDLSLDFSADQSFQRTSPGRPIALFVQALYWTNMASKTLLFGSPTGRWLERSHLNKGEVVWFKPKSKSNMSCGGFLKWGYPKSSKS